MKKTIEQLVSDTILQDAQEIIVGDKIYKMASPTTATLIEVSKYVSQLPDLKMEEGKSVLPQVLAFGCDCEHIADIAAIMILGKKNLITTKEIKTKKLFGLISETKTIEVNNQKELAQDILLKVSAQNLEALIIALFQVMGVSFFFSISVFLKDANMLRKTKTETTASGL